MTIRMAGADLGIDPAEVVFEPEPDEDTDQPEADPGRGFFAGFYCPFPGIPANKCCGQRPCIYRRV
jgi:hypothetical protein